MTIDDSQHADNATSLPEICAQVNIRVETFLNTEPKTDRIRRVQEQSRLSLRILGEALDRYSLDELSLSYNGGKDCLVLLILYLSALHKWSTSPPPELPVGCTQSPDRRRLPNTLRSVYIVSPHPFAEVDDFVNESSRKYHLDLARYTNSMREAFTAYLADHPRVKSIFVGTRRTDPHGADLKFFDPTDRGWPAFMRIHPVIDWHYAEVWTFIRELGVPYCDLYDKGYTSLGGTTDTHPNPALKDGEWEGYRPAYELEMDEEERLGRDK